MNAQTLYAFAQYVGLHRKANTHTYRYLEKTLSHSPNVTYSSP